MQAHTRRHPIEKETAADMKSDAMINWRTAFTDLIDKFSEAGATLRGLRMRDGLTQKELAQKMGISQANISKMEHGKRPIGDVLAKKFASFFHTDYRVFL
jgi:DNA-binding XRE family transcriptional regulator